MTFPRNIDDSVRSTDDKRKRARESKKKSKEEEKVRKQEQLKRLKAEKQKEILAKLKDIEKITGTTVNFNVDMLSGDFDESQHEAMMSAMFNDEYYQDEDGEMDVDELRKLVYGTCWSGFDVRVHLFFAVLCVLFVTLFVHFLLLYVLFHRRRRHADGQSAEESEESGREVGSDGRGVETRQEARGRYVRTGLRRFGQLNCFVFVRSFVCTHVFLFE